MKDKTQHNCLQETIELQIEQELGFRWTEQMRHGHKALKLWNALVETRIKLANCVNAMEGINPEAVPKLLEACKTLRKALWIRRYTFTFMARDRQAMSDGTEAINQAEGGRKA